MKLSLVVVPCLLMVVLVACRHHRPSYFGRKYVVYGDTKQSVCYHRLRHRRQKCSTRWYQTQYFQNLNKPGIILHIDTNQRKVYERNFYNRSRTFRRYYRQRLDVSRNKCRLTSLQRLPILHVPASFTYHGIADVEGKRCQIWQRVTRGSFGRPVIFRTWYVALRSYNPLQYEPVKHEYRVHGYGRFPIIRTRTTFWRGYNPGVKDSDLTLPAQCY